MSILYESNYGFYISHEKFVEDCYRNVSDAKDFTLDSNLFEINLPYKRAPKEEKRKRKPKRTICETKDNLQEIKYVEDMYKLLRDELSSAGLIETILEHSDNTKALETAQKIYTITGKCLISNAFGENTSPTIKTIDGHDYLFPANSRFYCKDVKEMKEALTDEKFDVIILDPPWWNKYIRRKKAKSNDGYQMLHVNDLRVIPVEELLMDDGLLVVWCTNSQQQLFNLLGEVFVKWKVEFVSKWFWVKVTKGGETVCPFSEPNGKQPFEQIIFARRSNGSHKIPTDGKVVASVPSALHSHKPPLMELLKPFIPESQSCLEIFARYLLPNCTSYGLEALRFQHVSLYTEIKTPT